MIAFFIGIFTFAFSPTTKADTPRDKRTSEREVSKIVPNRISEYIVSPDGKRVAYIAGEGAYDPEFGEDEAWEKYTVVVDGKPGKRYTYIKDPQFSPDSRRLAYLTRDLVVVDRVEGERFGNGSNLPANGDIRDIFQLGFSPDGKSYAYVASNYKAEGPSYIVINGKKLKSYGQVAEPLFSPDSKRIAYKARIDNPYGELVVLDGQEGKLYTHIGHLTFSPDSKRLSYIAESGSGKGANRFFVINGKNGKSYAGIGDGKFSPDSQHFLYIARIDGSKQTVVVDEKEGKHFDAWNIAYPIFSPDSNRVAFVVKPHNPDVKNGEQFVVVDGQEGKRYSEVWLQCPKFSFDSKHVAYAANNGIGWFVVIDGKEGKPYSFVSGMIFNPSDSQLAYVAYTGTKQFVVHGENIGKQYDQIADLLFSADGKTLAYAAYTKKSKKWFVVINGQEQSEFDFVLAKDAYEEKEPTKSIITGSLRFDLTNKLRYLAVRKNRILLIETQTR